MKFAISKQGSFSCRNSNQLSTWAHKCRYYFKMLKTFLYIYLMQWGHSDLNLDDFWVAHPNLLWQLGDLMQTAITLMLYVRRPPGSFFYDWNLDDCVYYAAGQSGCSRVWNHVDGGCCSCRNGVLLYVFSMHKTQHRAQF